MHQLPPNYLIYAETPEGNLLDIPGCQEMTAYATLQEAVDAAWAHHRSATTPCAREPLAASL